MFKLYNFEYTKGQNAQALTSILQNHFLPRSQKICISGIGGDELYDDYQPDKTAFGRIGKIIGGWPADLRTIYPWHDYADSKLHRQIHRSDMICGHHGIEGRYPLTDQRLFQCFLNTTAKLKNSGYKHWQVSYMQEHDYPITLNKTRFAS
jgi:asparagine synthetase B (glutamine-hydrolysing)